jgi:hypothetical protein
LFSYFCVAKLDANIADLLNAIDRDGTSSQDLLVSLHDLTGKLNGCPYAALHPDVQARILNCMDDFFIMSQAVSNQVESLQKITTVFADSHEAALLKKFVAEMQAQTEQFQKKQKAQTEQFQKKQKQMSDAMAAQKTKTAEVYHVARAVAQKNSPKKSWHNRD